MADFTAAVATTVVLTGVFIYFLTQADFEAIKGNWAQRRCDLSVMLMAGVFKPADDSRTTTEYAKENFTFCSKQIVDNVLRTAFAPLYNILGGAQSSLNSMAGPMNSLRAMLKRAADIFQEYLDGLLMRYKLVTAQLVRVQKAISNAIGRLQAIMFSAVYLGLSLTATAENTVRFAINVVLAVIGIMAAMIILLFFVLFPFIPLILTTITALTAAGFGAAAGMAGAFCIDPDALVVMEDGKKQPLHSVKCGDRLAPVRTPYTSRSTQKSNIVTGVLHVDASKEPIVEIQGVKMSGSHRVFHQEKWILAKEHPAAIPISDHSLKELICLNTTSHTVSLVTNEPYSYLIAGDWEEVDSVPAQKKWIDTVNVALNKSHSNVYSYPTAVPLVGASTLVATPSGNIPIQRIALHDTVLDAFGRPTKVVGLYTGQMKVELEDQPVAPEWVSDGVWRLLEGFWWGVGYGVKAAPARCEDTTTITGYYLVTEAETFQLSLGVHGTSVGVRDFTEVGASKLEQTYEMLSFLMNKK
jgi:hypothetical protein